MNPRLPLIEHGKSQAELLRYLDEKESLGELMASMAVSGFFANEALLVLPADENGRHVVVEGNRRLASLMILLQLPIAQEAGVESDYDVSGEVLQSLSEIPIYVLDDREEVSLFLGFRHIGGMKTWSAEAKARYLYNEVEIAVSSGDADPFRTVGRRTGSNAMGVRNAYRSWLILRSAESDFGIDSGPVMQDRFAVWTRLLGTENVPKFIGLSPTNSYEQIKASVEELNPERLSTVLSDLVVQPGRRVPVIRDSRQVTRYSAILGNAAAYETLRRSEDIELAFEIVQQASFESRVRRVTQSCTTLFSEAQGYDLDQGAADAVEELFRSARLLRGAVNEIVSGAE